MNLFSTTHEVRRNLPPGRTWSLCLVRSSPLTFWIASETFPAFSDWRFITSASSYTRTRADAAMFRGKYRRRDGFHWRHTAAAAEAAAARRRGCEGERMLATHSREVVHLVPERHRAAVGLGTFRAPALFLDRRNAEARVLPVAVLAHDAAAAAGVSHSAPLTLSPPPRPPRPVRARRHAASWAYRLSSIAPAWALPQAPHQRAVASSFMPKVELLRAHATLAQNPLVPRC